jgi:polar amino acid transport system permease protein
MEALIQGFFNLDIMRQAWPFLLRGFGMTLFLCAVVIPLGFAGGLAVALLSRARSRPLRWLMVGYVDLFRALPPLVLLIFVAAGLPFAGVDLPPLASVCIAFLLNTSSYYGEIFRAGIDSVPKGQTEAARSTGIGAGRTMLWVVLPQAVRNVLPDLLSNTLEVAKLTSIASVVAFQELLYAADMARSLTYNASPLVMAAAFYLILLWPLVRLLSLAERRIASH